MSARTEDADMLARAIKEFFEEFGRMPKRIGQPTTDAQRLETTLHSQYYDAKRHGRFTDESGERYFAPSHAGDRRRRRKDKRLSSRTASRGRLGRANCSTRCTSRGQDRLPNRSGVSSSLSDVRPGEPA